MISVVNNWALAKKMALAFTLIGALLLALATAGIWTNRDLTARSQRHVERGILGTEALGRATAQLREQRIIVYSYYNALDAKEASSLEQRMEKSHKDLDAAILSYASVAEELGPKVEQLQSTTDDLKKVNARIFEARRTGQQGEVLALIKGEGKKLSHDAIEAVADIQKLHQARSAESDRSGRAAAAGSLYVAILLSIVSLGGLIAIWLLINRTVARPMAEVAEATTTLAAGGVTVVPHRGRADELGRIADAVELFRQAAVDRAATDARIAAEQQIVTTSLEESLDALSKGDLTREVAVEFPAAYAALKTNFNAAVCALRNLIGAVGESAAQIRTGSGEIAQASEDLARRTESNAASLEETSAALVQIDTRIKATAEAAGRTVKRADQTISTVSGGRAIADEAVQAMGRVSESAKGIDNVIEGLDKIAFQTRVLAMNAAVEAGRAGEAGRGFAVVADLVSALAMRAEEEAKRARDQLTVTQSEIGSAVDAVTKVDGALQDISGDVGEVHQLLGNMASDNQAQASAITQISAAIGSMDQATQQNAAMVEETSAAARNLTSEVETLAEQANRFRTGGESARPRTGKPEPSVAPRHFVPAKPRAADGANGAHVSPVAALPSNGRTNGFDDWQDF
jgi:methyl-accepting chemotaxis protein